MRIEALKAAEPAVQTAPETAAVTGQRSANAGAYPAATHAHSGLPALELGLELSAFVVEELTDGRVVLQLGDTLVEAENPGQLHAGQHLRVRVELLQPQVLLQIVEQELTPMDQMAQLLRQKLPPNEAPWLGDLLRTIASTEAPSADAPAALDKLKLFLADLITREGGWTVSRLLRFVRDGGLQYEAKLLRAAATNSRQLNEIADHDLKGLLLGVLEELQSATVSNAALGAIERGLHEIEGQQAANLLAQAERGSVQLTIPLFFGIGTTDVALSIQPDGESAGGQHGRKPAGYKILFALELENFGRVRIDAHIKEKDLRAHFYVEEEKSLGQLSAMLPELQESLRNLGYQGVALMARPLRDIPTDQEHRFNALALGVPADMQLLNVKV